MTGVPGAVSVEQAERTVEIKWQAVLLAVRHLNISYLMNVFLYLLANRRIVQYLLLLNGLACDPLPTLLVVQY